MMCISNYLQKKAIKKKNYSPAEYLLTKINLKIRFTVL